MKTDQKELIVIDRKVADFIIGKGGEWACYRNEALDSRDLGRVAFLKYGKGCTFTSPPENYPGSISCQWAYCLIGVVKAEELERKNKDGDVEVEVCQIN